MTRTVELYPHEHLRILRSRLELTQSALAKRLGVSRQAVNYYEQGVNSIPATTLATVERMTLEEAA